MATDIRKISKLFIIPQRYILGIMCCGSITISVALREGFLVTLNFFSFPTNKTQIVRCLSEQTEGSSNYTTINAGRRYELDQGDRLLLRSSFFWMHPVCQLVAGVVSDQYGAKHTIGIPILLVMVITFITPFIIEWTEGNVNVLITIRVMAGLIQGWIVPSVFSILSQWVPKSERSFIATLSVTGISLGKAVANSATKLVISLTNRWSYGFYLYGLMSLVWFIIWNLICYSSPQAHPFISDKEKEYLKRKLDGHVFLGGKKFPVWSILKSVPLWATVLVQFGQIWNQLTMVAKLPEFVRIHYGIHEEEHIKMDTIPYLCLVLFSLICGLFSDLILNKNYLTITTIRKVLTTVGSMGPGIFILAASLLECHRKATLAMFCVGMVLNSGFFASSMLNPLDHAPNFAGTLRGIINTFITTVGVIGPVVEGTVTNEIDERSAYEWRIIFVVTFVILVLTNFVYVLIGSSEEQDWNKLE